MTTYSYALPNLTKEKEQRLRRKRKTAFWKKTEGDSAKKEEQTLGREEAIWEERRKSGGSELHKAEVESCDKKICR